MTSPWPLPALVHHRILAHATLRPRALAVVAGRQRVSYATLAARVAVVARMLAAEGVGPDQIVGLHTPRSVDGVVGLLGILAAGGAYLYLDPASPGDRIAGLASAAGVRVVVDCTPEPTRLAASLPRIRISHSTGDRPAPLRRRPPPDIARPWNLAYVACTADQSRAVAVEHAGMANRTRHLADILGLCPGRRLLQVANWTRDTGIAEMLVPLAAGATVVLAPDTTRHDPARLTDPIRQHRVDTVLLPATVLRQVRADQMPRLRTIVVDGPCPPELIDVWATPERRLFTSHSLTEATGIVSIGACHPGDDLHVGAPLPGVLIRIVDDTGRPVPAGQPGHLFVGGVGVARGFLDVDPLGGRFLRDPDGTRWVRTDDLVRQRPDGILIHLGRDRPTQGHCASTLDTTPGRRADVSAAWQAEHGGPAGPDQPPRTSRPGDPDRTLRLNLPGDVMPTCDPLTATTASSAGVGRRSSSALLGSLLVALLAWLVSGCDRGTAPGPALSPPRHTPSAVGSSAAARTEVDMAVAVVADLLRAYVAASNAGTDDTAELARYASGSALRVLLNGLADNKAKGLHTQGTPTNDPPQVTSVAPVSAPTRVSVRLCLDDSRWLVYRSDGRLADATPGGRRLATAEVKKVGGVWKVDSFGIRGVGTCDA